MLGRSLMDRRTVKGRNLWRLLTGGRVVRAPLKMNRRFWLAYTMHWHRRRGVRGSIYIKAKDAGAVKG